MFNKIRTYLSDPQHKKLVGLFAIIAIVIAVPLTVLLSQQQQTYRQRASELISPPSLPFPISTPLPPNPSLNPISWRTDHVYLQADDFYIIANGKKYLANTKDVELNSSAPYPPDFKNTSLEAEWRENNARMRMFIYFEQQNNKWKVSEIRTYNGSAPEDWIYYQGFEGNNVGLSLIKPVLDLSNKKHPYNPSNPDTGSIHFSNLKLQPFLVQIPKTGYYIYRNSSIISVPAPAQQNTTYGVYAILFKDGSVLKNQSGLSYVWTIADNTVATIKPYVEPYDCQTLSIQPCPQGRLHINGLRPGTTTIQLDVKDAQQNIIATTTFNLTVVSSSVSSSTPKQDSCTACSADINKDGIVNTEDITLVNSCIKKPIIGMCINADVNKDGKITIIDANCVLRNNRKQCVVPSGAPSPTPFSTPKPIITSKPTIPPLGSNKRVFVTSTNYNGNLGGLAGADAKCQERANTAKLGGTWKAWLSDNVTSATSRLIHHNLQYKRIDGTIILSSWADLVDGFQGPRINITELGATKTGYAWTNTKADGNIGSFSTPASNGGHCFNWQSSTASLLGWVGSIENNNYNTQWTSITSRSCSQANSLYCFEQ